MLGKVGKSTWTQSSHHKIALFNCWWEPVQFKHRLEWAVLSVYFEGLMWFRPFAQAFHEGFSLLSQFYCLENVSLCFDRDKVQVLAVCPLLPNGVLILSNLFPLSPLTVKSPHLFPPDWLWLLLILPPSFPPLQTFCSVFLPLHSGRNGEYFFKLSFLSSSFRKLTAGLFSSLFFLLCWLSINSWILCLSEKPQLRLHKMKHRTTLGNRKVFSIITYYMCLANQKHLRRIWLKRPQNHSKIGLTHAGSGARAHTRGLHCAIVGVGLFAGCFFSWPQLRKWISNMVLLP